MAAQAPPKAFAADIVVFSLRMSVGSMIQVKTRTGGRDGGWHMQVKHESLVHPRLFYVFVDLEPAAPVCYVIPSSVVAQVVTETHARWLAAPGLRNRPHRDSPVRRLMPKYVPDAPGFPAGWMEAYRERWGLISSDPVTVTQDGPAS